ncbi:MAG: hypothetical protein MR270_04215 [Erysipelotrichaceae bacterium]|nr:hypothetical protein [Erysipelotrichaceae bacterium]
MEKYKIANLRVDMNIHFDLLKNQAKKYLTNDDNIADITIDKPIDFLLNAQKKYTNFTLQEIEYMCYGAAFYNNILNYDGFMLHSSAVCKDNYAYLFSANSGVGKSTHAQNWLKYFNDDSTYIINDDKPAIRKIDGKFYCCGTPFSGKVDLSKNECILIKAIVFIKRGEENSICKITTKKAFELLYQQTITTLAINKMDTLLALIDELFNTIPVYELTCNKDISSAKIAYDFINSNE